MNKLICGLLVLTLFLSCGPALAEDETQNFVVDEVQEQGIAPDAEETPVEDEANSTDAQTTNAKWSFPISPLEIDSPYYLVVNASNLLGEDYKPESLVKVTNLLRATSADVFMDQVAFEALTQMFEAAKLVKEYSYVTLNTKGEEVESVATYGNDGMLLYLKGGYRSYGTQQTAYTNFLARNNNVDDGSVEKPGANEHQSGLCADVVNGTFAKSATLTTDFSLTAEAHWLRENCAKFGFILRYQEAFIDELSHAYEPWHIRYVGKDAASFIMENQITLEEFSQEFSKMYEKFMQNGGDINAISEMDLKMLPESSILDIHGDDGDNDVSLSF